MNLYEGSEVSLYSGILAKNVHKSFNITFSQMLLFLLRLSFDFSKHDYIT